MAVRLEGIEGGVVSEGGVEDTVTVVLAVTEPLLLVAVKVYVVVTVGDTVLLVNPVTSPTLLIDNEVAPLTDQDRVEDWPEVMEEGEEEKELIIGVEVEIPPIHKALATFTEVMTSP